MSNPIRSDAPKLKPKRADRYEILLKIIKKANSTLDPSQVVGSIMTHIQKLIPCEGWSILLLTSDEKELEFVNAKGSSSSHLRRARLKVGEGIAGWVAQHKKAAIVNDARIDKRFNSQFDDRSHFKTTSVLCAPLLSREKLMGVVELVNRKGPKNAFSQQDLKTLMTVVTPVATSLHNAILFQQTQRLTITDDLTRLYNNRYINSFLAKTIAFHQRKNKKFSIIFLDLDGFKSVNDSYGHLIGGKTLVEVGKLISSRVRKEDVVARYGGDEFIVILPELDGNEALAIAESIRKDIIQHDFKLALERDIKLSASFGISVFPENGITQTELIQKADNAMYRVKYSGKNSVQLAQ